jgi:MFS family permease
MCFFLVGSWFCGAAQSMLQMSLARGIAGLGGGGIMTMASVVIHDLIPMRDRGKYQSYVNMAQTVSLSMQKYRKIINLPRTFRLAQP